MTDELRKAAQRVENAIAACLQEVEARIRPQGTLGESGPLFQGRRPDYPELYAAREALRAVLDAGRTEGEGLSDEACERVSATRAVRDAFLAWEIANDDYSSDTTTEAFDVAERSLIRAIAAALPGAAPSLYTVVMNELDPLPDQPSLPHTGEAHE